MLALVERWWETTHTLHIASREMTLTLHETYHLTGLYYRGPSMKFRGLPDEALLGHTFRTATVNLGDLYLLNSRSQTTQRDQERMARAFTLFLIGSTVVANAAGSVLLGYLIPLVELEEAAT